MAITVLPFFQPSPFVEGDWSQFLSERAGTCLGTALTFTPAKAGSNVAKISFNIARNELGNTVVSKMTKCFTWYKTNVPSSIGQAALKTSQVAKKSLVAKGGAKIDLDALSKAREILDRNGLTKAGRALQKHGGQPGPSDKNYLTFL